MGKVIFKEKYKPILNKLKEEMLKNDVKPDVEMVKKLLAKMIIHVLNLEEEKMKTNS